MPAIAELSWQEVPWGTTATRLDQYWIAKDNPHHSIIGLTGSGKSYLVVNGILKLAQRDKVLIIDVKGDDPTLRGVGKPVRSIPSKYFREARSFLTEERSRDNWYRLLVDENVGVARRQIHTALSQVWAEGEWIIYIDELRAFVDTPANMGVGMRGWWNKLMLRGRSKGISVINATQEPSWVPSGFYTQPSFLWFGKVEDERAHKRIAEVGATKALAAFLPSIPKHKFLYSDGIEDSRVFHLTGL